MTRRILAALVLTAAATVAQISPFEFYGAERGLSSLSIEAITQDADRVLWVGTRDGLFRFNGERFEWFTEQQGLPSRRVHAMLVFQSRLWVATDRGITAWNGARFAPPPGVQALNEQAVHALAVSNGRLFAAADNGLWQLWDRTMVVLNPDPTYALHAQPDGPLWAAGAGSLWRIDPQTGRGEIDGQDLPDRDWRGVATSKDGLLWVRANGELWNRRPGAANFTLARTLVRTPDNLALFPMPDGDLMVPSVNGVLIWRERKWEVLNETGGLFGSWASCVYWDHEGNLWVGLPTVGVARERGNGRWVQWTYQSGLPQSTVTAIARDWMNRVWVGTPAGLARPERSGTTQALRVIGTRQGLPNDRVSTLAGDDRGGLWIGYDDSGIARFDLPADRAQVFGPPRGLEAQQVWTIEIGPGGDVWAATQQGLYTLPGGDPNGRFERIAQLEGPVYDIAFGSGVEVWAATDRGLWHRGAAGWRAYTTREGLPEDRVRFAEFAADGTLWIGFAERGVARLLGLNGDLQVQPFPKRVGAMQSNDLTFLQADPRGWMWVGTTRGVNLYDGNAWRPLIFSSGLAWPDTQTDAFLLDANGWAWVGTSGGLSLYMPPDPLPPLPAPGVWLFSAQFAAPTETSPDGLVIPWRGRSLTARFGPATFERGEAASIRYRLRGVNDDWTETSERTLTFSNLRAREYTLELAASVDGVHWSETPLRLPFRIEPPWWRHWYVLVPTALLIALVLRGAWVIRMRRYMALRVKLEQEIAEQQRSLEQARRTAGEMDRRFRSLLEDVRLAALIFDREGKIAFCNDHLLSLTGWRRDELLGLDWIDTFIPEHERATMRARFSSDDLESTGGDHHECVILNAHGAERILQCSNTPLRDASGAVTAIACIGTDITEQRRLDEQLRQIQKMESLGRLAGGVAHDFNNLLTVINGYADLLLRKLPTTNVLRRQVEEIRKAGGRAFEITQQMLIFSRRQPIQPAPLSLNQVIQESQSLLERVLGESVRLILNLEPELQLVRGDSGQMCQILLNLATNARDAMPEGGTCTVETANEAEGLVRLSVSDTGVGMSEDTQRHIFEPFYTLKEKGRGTGLGLATVYGIVKQGGGSIHVTSAPGEGARFDVRLPVVEPQPADESPRGLVAISAAHRAGRVLVAEDDAVVKEFVIEVLKSQGYEVIAASSGAEALDTAGSSVDLLVTDVIMPGMSGPELAARLQERIPGLRVLYMSGYTDDVLTPAGIADTGASFLAKPFAPEALLHKVREAMAVAERKLA